MAESSISDFAPDEMHATYPCPECNGVSDGKLAIFGASEICSNVIDDPAYKDATRRKAAAALSQHMLAHGLISFDERPYDEFHSELIARVGVASKERVASLEQRINEKQFDRMDELISKAEQEIYIWRRDIDGARGWIEKDQASRALRRALKEMKEPSQ